MLSFLYLYPVTPEKALLWVGAGGGETVTDKKSCGLGYC